MLYCYYPLRGGAAMSENFMEQSVPYAEEAEAGIIAAMFKDREVLQDVV